jgi:hypothetical protein
MCPRDVRLSSNVPGEKTEGKGRLSVEEDRAVADRGMKTRQA